MAAGILSGMEGKRGIRAWRWLFIIEVKVSRVFTRPFTSNKWSPGLYYDGCRDCRYVRCYKTILIRGGCSLTSLFVSWSLPDYPHNTSWVRGQARRLAQARLAEDASEADKDTKEDSYVILFPQSLLNIDSSIRPMKGLMMALADVKVWILMLLNLTQLLGLSFVNFFPT